MTRVMQLTAAIFPGTILEDGMICYDGEWVEDVMAWGEQPEEESGYLVPAASPVQIRCRLICIRILL